MNVLRPIQKEFYGDDQRWFLGYVINAAPPAGLEGRVKIRIIGVHNADTGEIPEADLPWAQVLIPTTEGGSSGIGRIPQLTKGAFVFGMFLDGMSSQIPLVIGSMPHTELPSDVQKLRRVDPRNSGFKYDQNRIQNVVIEPIFQDDIPFGDLGTRRLQSMKFFIDNGYTVMHAAAITGALQAVSQFNTYNLEESTGIAKWNKDGSIGSRYAGLLQFSQSYRPHSNWKLFSVQLQYVLFELRTRFNLANSKLISTNNIKDASIVVNKFYLDKGGVSDQIAQRAYEEITSA